MKMISVIMPVYNAEKYLIESIESILSQSYIDFELIIINDGSTDNSDSIIRGFKDSRIRYLCNEDNRGIVYTLNRGIETAKGYYIARMDADDISLPDRLEKQKNFLDKNESIDICGTSFYELDENCKKIIMPTSNQDIRAKLLFESPICHPSVMIRRKVFDSGVRYSNEYQGMEDYKLWSDLLLKFTAHNLREPLLKYRIIDTGITQQLEKKTKERMESHRRLYTEIFKKNGFSISGREISLHAIVQNNYSIKYEYYKDIIYDYVSFAEHLDDQNIKNSYCSVRKLNRALGKNLIRILIYNAYKINIKDILRFRTLKYIYYGLEYLIMKNIGFDQLR